MLSKLAHYNAFSVALTAWREAAHLHAEAKEAYRALHAQSYLASTEKTGDARKAAADVATSALRLTRDKCEVEERTAYHRLIMLRGPAGERDDSIAERAPGALEVTITGPVSLDADSKETLERIAHLVDQLPTEKR